MPDVNDQISAETPPDASNSSSEAVQNPPVAQAAPENEGDPNPPEPGKGTKPWYQRRFDELTELRRQAEDERNHWRDLATAGKKQEQKEQPKQVDPEAPVKPKIADFNDYDKFESAKDEYFEKLADYKARKAVEGVTVKTEQQKRASEWDARQAEARKTYTDFDEVISSSEKLVTPAMAHAIVNGEAGTDIAYFLGKNPAELKRISAIQDPLLQVKELGKIEARIAQDKSAEATVDPPAQTRAPKPPTPIQKTSSTDTSLRDDLPLKEWNRRREAMLRSK